jgi:hypothetical protein
MTYTNATSGIKSLRKLQIGTQTDPTVAVPATARWRGVGTMTDARVVQFPTQEIGMYFETDDQVTTKLLGEVTTGPDDASWEQLPYLFEAGIKQLAAPTADGGGTGKIYPYPMSNASQNALRFLSVEGGDDQLVEFSNYVFAKEIVLDGKMGEPLKVSSKLTGQSIERGVYASASTISFDNSHHILDSASGFTAAAGWAVGQVVKVTGTVNNNGLYTITTRADGQLTVTENTATEAAGTLFTIQQWFSGGATGLALPAVEFIAFSKSKLFIDAAGGTMGSTQMSRTMKSAKVTIKTGAEEIPAGDGALTFSFVNITKPAITVEVEFWYAGNAAAEKQNWKDKVARLLRIQVLGSALTTAGAYTYKTLNIDLPGRWTKFAAIQDQNGADFVVGTFEAKYNPTAALVPTITLVNQLAALP